MGLFIWAAVVLGRMGAEPGRIVVRFLDMITVAVPPALPACLSIALVFSISRLRRIGIFVTGPHTINIAGQLDVICFDKTGETMPAEGGSCCAILLLNCKPHHIMPFAHMQASAWDGSCTVEILCIGRSFVRQQKHCVCYGVSG